MREKERHICEEPTETEVVTHSYQSHVVLPSDDFKYLSYFF